MGGVRAVRHPHGAARGGPHRRRARLRSDHRPLIGWTASECSAARECCFVCAPADAWPCTPCLCRTLGSLPPSLSRFPPMRLWLQGACWWDRACTSSATTGCPFGPARGPRSSGRGAGSGCTPSSWGWCSLSPLRAGAVRLRYSSSTFLPGRASVLRPPAFGRDSTLFYRTACSSCPR